jgi:hypothetical protein
VGRALADRSAFAADREAQIQRRFRWWPEGISLEALAADLGWPGGLIGVVGALTELQRRRLAHEKGGKWFAGEKIQEIEEIKETIGDEDDMHNTEKIKADLEKYGPSLGKDVHKRTGIEKASTVLAQMYARGQITRTYSVPGFLYDVVRLVVAPSVEPPKGLGADLPTGAATLPDRMDPLQGLHEINVGDSIVDYSEVADKDVDELEAIDLALGLEGAGQTRYDGQRADRIRVLARSLEEQKERSKAASEELGQALGLTVQGLEKLARMAAACIVELRKRVKFAEDLVKAAPDATTDTGPCPAGWRDIEIAALIDFEGELNVWIAGEPTTIEHLEDEGWNRNMETAWVGRIRLREPVSLAGTQIPVVDLRARRAS